MHSILDSAAGKADIVLIQEPWTYRNMSSIQHPSFNCLLPPVIPGRLTRVLSFVTKPHLFPNLQVTQLNHLVNDPDVQLLQVQTPHTPAFTLVNIYNQESPPSEPPHGRAETRILSTLNLTTRTILAGDFNAHHPWWNSNSPPAGINSNLLVDILEESELILLNEPDIPTHINNTGQGTSVLDLVFFSPDMINEADEWAVEEEEEHTGSDHMAIWFSILPSALAIIETPLQPRLNWKKTDWKTFSEVLKSEFQKYSYQFNSLLFHSANPANLDTACFLLTDLITQAATSSTPINKPSAYSKVWWNEDIREARKRMSRDLRRWKESRSEDHWTTYKESRNLYFHSIRKAKADNWISFLEQASGKDIFQILRYTRPRRTQLTPAIKNGDQLATTFEEKCRVFHDTIFPEPPSNRPSVPDNLPEPISWKTLTRNELATAIYTSNPKKAPGPDNISFLCIQHALQTLPDEFFALYSRLTQLGYHPSYWRSSTTVIIPKPGKASYDIPKSYRPIALLNCLGKVLEKIMATRLSWLVENHNLLYKDQLGGRSQRSAPDAVMALVHHVENAKSNGQVASALFMDVKGAFDNVSAERLVVTMKKMGLPFSIVDWVESFLSERKTQLAFDGLTEAMGPVQTGIPQGSPISPILFLIYLQPLFEHLSSLHPDTFFPSYIDDVGIVVSGPTEASNARHLQQIADTTLHWSRENALTFDGPKTELIHFIKRRIPRPPAAVSITLNGSQISPSDKVKWLGIWLDQNLTFHHHIKERTASATRAYFALKRLASTQSGLTVKAMRLLYQSAIIPVMDYGAEVWFKGERQSNLISELQKVQNKALRSVLGAFRTSPSAALEVEAAVPPVIVRLKNTRRKFGLRLLTLPLNHTLRNLVPSTFPPAYTTGRDTTEEFGKFRPWFTENSQLKFLSRLDSTLHSISPWVGPEARVETFSKNRNPPWYSPPPIDLGPLQQTRQEALQNHQQLLTTLSYKQFQWTAYSDASKLSDGRTGFGIHFANTSPEMIEDKMVYIGKEVDIFDGELQGLTETISTLTNLAFSTPSPPTDIWIFLDNTSAIQRIQSLHPGPGQQLASQIHRQARRLQQLQTTLHVHWVPGHSGVLGNSTADRLAKRGAGLYTHKASCISLSWIKYNLKEMAFQDWMDHWRTSNHGRSYGGTPQRKMDFVFQNYPRRITSQLLQLRTGHGYFRNYLHRINPEDHPSPICFCGQERQTPSHLLLKCQLFRRQRDQLKNRMGSTPFTLTNLLYTRKGIEKLVPFLEETKVASRWWMIGEGEDGREEQWWRGMRSGWGRIEEGVEEV